MKANEIQIGDWLYYKGQFNAFPFKVESITKKKVGYHAEPNKHRMYFLRLSECKPIPLTPEILEKNGWVYNNEDEKFFPQTWVGGGLMLQGADDCGYRIVVTSDYDDEDTNNTPFVIIYIYELQHALRLRRIKKEIEL